MYMKSKHAFVMSMIFSKFARIPAFATCVFSVRSEIAQSPKTIGETQPKEEKQPIRMLSVPSRNWCGVSPLLACHGLPLSLFPVSNVCGLQARRSQRLSCRILREIAREPLLINEILKIGLAGQVAKILPALRETSMGRTLEVSLLRAGHPMAESM